MPTFTIVLLIILAVLIVLLVVLYFLGKKAQKTQDEQNAMIERTSQSVSMLIIDKKKLRLKDSGLPAEVMANAPFYSKITKLPVIKAKVGPKMMNFVCDPSIYDTIPLKREVKATISGMYISSIRELHGKTDIAPKKKKLWDRLLGR